MLYILVNKLLILKHCPLLSWTPVHQQIVTLIPVCKPILYIYKICNWQLFSWNLTFQKKQHRFQVWNVLYISFANAALAEFRKQRKLPYSSALDQGHTSLPLHCCSCHPLNHHETCLTLDTPCGTLTVYTYVGTEANIMTDWYIQISWTALLPLY